MSSPPHTPLDASRPASLRIGDVARLVGTTPRTIRYYEEIGLLAEAPSRPAGQHRLYTQAEVERLREVMRLKHLLGVSLEELRTLLTAEEARAEVRAQLRREDVEPERRRELLGEALGHIDRQLELVRNRAGELARLEAELAETRRRVTHRIREWRTRPSPPSHLDGPPHPPSQRGVAEQMTSIEVKASPAGVPGGITEDAPITAEQLTYSGAGGTPVNGYLARPAAGGAHPAISWSSEAHGLNDHIRDVADRFANLGYVALAVDLYTREGGPPPAGDMEALMKRLFSMSDATVLGDLEGAADFLRARDDVSGKVGCIGFCMGGRYTLLFAVSSDRLDAAVDCWGGFIDRRHAPRRTHARAPDASARARRAAACPLLAAVGARGPEPLARDRRAPARARTRERPRGPGGRLRGRRARLLRRLPTDLPPGGRSRLWSAMLPFLERPGRRLARGAPESAKAVHIVRGVDRMRG